MYKNNNKIMIMLAFKAKLTEKFTGNLKDYKEACNPLLLALLDFGNVFMPNLKILIPFKKSEKKLVSFLKKQYFLIEGNFTTTGEAL